MSPRRRRDGEERSQFGAAHVNARDAYQGVPILQPPTWRNEIGGYFFLGGISSGAAVIAALAELFGGPALKRLARVAHLVSWVALLPCPPLLIADLGVPTRFHHMLRVFKPSSPMNLGSWILTGHGAITTLGTMRLFAERIPVVGGLLGRLPNGPIAAAEVPFGLGLGGYTGVLLGTTSVPMWSNSPFLGALFMASAMGTGAAAVSLAASATGESEAERDVLGTISLGSGLTELALLALYLATSGPAARPLLEGRAGLLTLGGAATTASAIVLEAAASRLPVGGSFLRGLASLGTLAAGAILRFSVVHAGRSSATDRDETLRSTASTGPGSGWGGPRVV